MKTLDLKNFSVQEMDAKEMAGIDGGLMPWAKIYKWVEKGLVALGAADAIDDFVEGWNSKKCNKRYKYGTIY